jgi:hypothetical protein
MKIEVHEAMKVKCLGMRCFNSAGVLFLVVCLSILNINIITARAAEIKTGKEGAKKVAGTNAADSDSVAKTSTQDQPPIKAPQSAAPSPETTTGSSGNTLLYTGIGIAAVAAVAAVAAGVGGSSSSEPEPPTPTLAPVGPDIGGKSWTGFLDLVDGIKEPVTATIFQNGAHVEITTSSTQEYGRKFVGQITRNGSMSMIDQITGEVWTTHFDRARSTRIDLYDFVHNNRDLDRLFLTRTTAE